MADSAALIAAISADTLSLDSLGNWLTFWTALVVVGLPLEYGHDIARLFSREAPVRPVARRQKGVVRKLFVQKLFLEVVGGILITVGVAGELGVQFKASRRETDLRNATDQLVAATNSETAKLRADNLALEELIQPRRVLLDSGPNAKSTSLRQHRGTRVFIEIASGPCGCDPEARQLANQLTWVLPQVGWKPELIQGAVPTNFMTEGVVIFARLVWLSLRERDLTHTPPTAREIVVNETFDAAKALDKYLKHFDVLSHVEEFATTNPLTFDLPPDAIVIFRRQQTNPRNNRTSEMARTNARNISQMV